MNENTFTRRLADIERTGFLQVPKKKRREKKRLIYFFWFESMAEVSFFCFVFQFSCLNVLFDSGIEL